MDSNVPSPTTAESFDAKFDAEVVVEEGEAAGKESVDIADAAEGGA